MKGLLTALALFALLPLDAAAEAHEPPVPEQLPAGREEAICLGGGAVIAAIASGVAAGPALVAVILCVIIAEDLRYHENGGTHSD